jgi:hypothetical protein
MVESVVHRVPLAKIETERVEGTRVVTTRSDGGVDRPRRIKQTRQGRGRQRTTRNDNLPKNKNDEKKNKDRKITETTERVLDGR